jgi:hypothetical protein
MNNTETDRQIAGAWKQFRILSWKNFKLLKRNKIGTLAECLVAVCFIFMIFINRQLTDTERIPKVNNDYVDVISKINISNKTTTVYYYPNNSFVLSIVKNTMQLIQNRKPFYFKGLQLIGLNKSDTSDLTIRQIQKMIAFISFENSTVSVSSLPSNLVYTLITLE